MFEQDGEARGSREEGSSANYVAEFYDLLFGEDDDLDYEAEFCEDDDDEGPFESLLRHAQAIEAGLMPGWKLDRSQAGALLWTTPSGRQYKSTLDGSSYVPALATSRCSGLSRPCRARSSCHCARPGQAADVAVS
jgi:hypothetical protein